jgi:hypothetical protein
VIEAVSWPGDLSDWDPKEQPYYLKLSGETSPVLDVAYSGPTAGDSQTAPAPGSIYEYWWTIGHAGFRPASAHWYDIFTGESDGFTIWTNLGEVEKNVAARVYLFFPRSRIGSSSCRPSLYSLRQGRSP